jgi:hypothetical protein
MLPIWIIYVDKLVIYFYVLHAKNVILYEFSMLPVEMIYVEIAQISCLEIYMLHMYRYGFPHSK